MTEDIKYIIRVLQYTPLGKYKNGFSASVGGLDTYYSTYNNRHHNAWVKAHVVDWFRRLRVE